MSRRFPQGATWHNNFPEGRGPFDKVALTPNLAALSVTVLYFSTRQSVMGIPQYDGHRPGRQALALSSNTRQLDVKELTLLKVKEASSWLRDYVTAIKNGHFHPFTPLERLTREATRDQPWCVFIVPGRRVLGPDAIADCQQP